MATNLSPGVFIEETLSAAPTSTNAATSIMGIVGFTPQGPTDTATLVTKDTYTKIFGGVTHNSYTGYNLAAFFANGGSQAYVVRVMPSDASLASGAIHAEQLKSLAIADGSTTAYSNSFSGASVMVPGGGIVPKAQSSIGVNMLWEVQSSTHSGYTYTMHGDGGTAFSGDSITSKIALHINTSDLAAVALGPAVKLTGASVRWTALTASKTITLVVTSPALSSTTTTVDGSATFDWQTGVLFLNCVEAPDTGTSVTMNFTTTQTVSLVDDGSGNLVSKSDSLALAGSDISAAGPFDVSGSKHWDAGVDGGSATVFTFGSTGASLVGSGATYASGATGFNLNVNGQLVPIVFTGTEATEAAYYGAINTAFSAATPTVLASAGDNGSGQILITTTGLKGTSSNIVVSGDSASLIKAFGTATPTVTPGTATINSTPVTIANTSAALSSEIVTAINTVGGVTGAVLTIGAGHGGSATQLYLARTVTGSSTGVSTYTTSTANLGFTPVASPAFHHGTAAFTVLTGPGSVNYTTGAWSFTTTSQGTPVDGARILATYVNIAWTLAPSAKGVWANSASGTGLAITLAGNTDSYNQYTGSYSAYDMNVLYNGSVVESYEALVFDDATATQYAPAYVNEISSYIQLTMGGAVPLNPNALNDLLGQAWSYNIASVDSASAVVVYTVDSAPIAPGSVLITYQDASGNTYTVTDNGLGALIGSVNPNFASTVTYATGAVSFMTVSTATAAGLVNMQFASVSGIYPGTQQTELFAGGTDGTFTQDTYGRDQLTNSSLLTATNKGLYALNTVDATLSVVVPDAAGDLPMTQDLLDYALSRTTQPAGGDRFIVLVVPKGFQADQAAAWNKFVLAQYSDYAALYWPWVQVSDTLSNNVAYTVPPLGNIAGVYATTDSNKNVGKSPGGTVDGALLGIIGLEYNPTQADRDLVYQARINPLISSPQTGLAVWGVRTISNTTDWKYINARRLFMYLEKSVDNATQWVVFENNGPALWLKIKSQLNSFLGNLYAQGYFAGNSASQAFFVTCDSTNNTPTTIAAGQVNITVGAAPNIPAEFCVFTFTTASLS